MEFLTNVFWIAGFISLAVGSVYAVYGIGLLWVRYPWPMFGAMIVLFAIGEFWSILAAFALLLAVVVAIVGDALNGVRRFASRKQSSHLHEHGDLGWHDHPYERNHRHYGNHMSGPFYYVDERVIDQRNEEH